MKGKGSFALVAAILLVTTGLAGCATPQQGEAAASACLDGSGSGGTESASMAGTAPTTTDADTSSNREEIGIDSVEAQQTGDPIKIGTLLPLTGQLKDFGPDMQKAVELAVQEVNDAGGVQGREVQVVQGDSKTDPSEAPQELNRLRQEGIVAFVGAASSGVSSSVIEQAVSNELVMITPASTSPALTDRQNNGFFYRVPPSDALQGKVMAQLLEDDGVDSIATVFVNNDYGQGFNDVLVNEYDGTVEAEVSFDNDATQFGSEVSELSNADAEAIVAIMYPGNGVPIMREAFNQGLTGEAKFYFSEGVKDESGFVAKVGNTSEGTSILEGCKGTTPEDFESNATKNFEQKFEQEYDHKPGLFAAHSYDAAVGLMAAMAYQGSDDPSEFKQSMRTVWNAPGQAVSDPAQAVTLASAGTDIDYEGASGNFDWNEKGEPDTGLYGIWEIQADGSIEILESGIQP